MAEVKEKLLCYHCGDECAADAVFADEKCFDFLSERFLFKVVFGVTGRKNYFRFE